MRQCFMRSTGILRSAQNDVWILRRAEKAVEGDREEEREQDFGDEDAGEEEDSGGGEDGEAGVEGGAVAEGAAAPVVAEQCEQRTPMACGRWAAKVLKPKRRKLRATSQ